MPIALWLYSCWAGFYDYIPAGQLYAGSSIYIGRAAAAAEVVVVGAVAVAAIFSSHNPNKNSELAKLKMLLLQLTSIYRSTTQVEYIQCVSLDSASFVIHPEIKATEVTFSVLDPLTSELFISG